MDYFLPGKNGLEITKELMARKIIVPIVFLTVNKDFDLALDVMKLGVADYLVKEEITSPVLPKTVLGVIEKRRLKDQLVAIEVSRQRLKTINEMLSGIIKEFEVPLDEMTQLVPKFRAEYTADSQKN